MTTNQLIAIGFPLLTAAAVGLTGLFIRKPWAKKQVKDNSLPDIEVVHTINMDVSEALTKADILIRTARERLVTTTSKS
jgi:hypothetical protein